MTFLKQIFISALLCSTSLYAADVMTWVPPYGIGPSKTALASSYSGVGPANGLTRVGLQFWTATSTGGVTQGTVDGNPTDADVNWFKSWASPNGIKVVLTIYNNDGSWNWSIVNSIISNATYRSNFANNLVVECNRLGLDGVDLDLEGSGTTLSTTDKNNFYALVNDLASQLHAIGKVLSVNSFAWVWNAPNSDMWNSLLASADFVQSMGYDQIGATGTGWDSYSGQLSMASGNKGLLLGMNASSSTWLSKTVAQHLDDAYALGAGIAIWDAQFPNSAWNNSTIWNKIILIKGTSGQSSSSAVSSSSVPASSSSVQSSSSAISSSSSTTPSGSFDLEVEGFWSASNDPTGSHTPVLNEDLRTFDGLNALIQVSFTVSADQDNGGTGWPWGLLQADMNGTGSTMDLSSVTSVTIRYKSDNPLFFKIFDGLLRDAGAEPRLDLPASPSAYSTVEVALSQFQEPGWALNPVGPADWGAVKAFGLVPNIPAGGSTNISVADLILNGYSEFPVSLNFAAMLPDFVQFRVESGGVFLESVGTLRAELFDLQGRSLTTASGQNQIFLSTSGLEKGLLFLRVRTELGDTVRKLNLVR